MRTSQPAGTLDEERQVWSVSELVESARDHLEDEFPAVFVRGEVSNFRVPSSGHWYFDLKEERARSGAGAVVVLPVAMFRRENAAVLFEVEEGMEIIAGGRLSIYPDQGKFQLIAQQLEPVGWGALQLAFEQLKARLQAEGLFDEARKRPLPLLPRCVGVVTSETGAAWRDLGRVWRRRQVPIRVILAPSRVQGPEAAQEIVAAIEALNRHAKAEALIVGRGGGSREDLWAFNEEIVARAIADSKIPVISAVGHEIDVTIADLVADRRAATPTAAAEIVAVSRDQLLDRLESARHRTGSAMRQRIAACRARLQRLDPRVDPRLRQPGRILEAYQQRLDDAFSNIELPLEELRSRRRRRLQSHGQRLVRANPSRRVLGKRNRLSTSAQRAGAGMLIQLQKRQSRLAAAAARTEALSPLAVLARGYSICERRRDSRIVRQPRDVEVGEKVRVRLERGQLDCEVEQVTETPGTARL